MTTEKPITIPLDKKTLDWLKSRAAANGRATGREGAAIINAEKARETK